MSWLQLDPESIASRLPADPAQRHIPSLGGSLARGVLGFTVVSVAGFAPWAVAGRQLHRLLGEAGLYLVCAALFIGLSGLLLHRLILGSGSLSRFYKLFGAAFGAYAVAWIVAWISLRGNTGSIAGLALGTAIMAGIFAAAFQAGGALIPAFAALFLCNTLGYFVGGWVEGAPALAHAHMAAKLLWGVCYGIGFGAGLGLAFYLCQARARALAAHRA
jgi:hypothetical protein